MPPWDFNPGTLLSFGLQGLVPSRDPCLVSEPDPPLPFVTCSPEGHTVLGFEGLLPLEIGIPKTNVPTCRGTHTLLAFPL
jgi:hypothetical protein